MLFKLNSINTLLFLSLLTLDRLSQKASEVEHKKDPNRGIPHVVKRNAVIHYAIKADPGSLYGNANNYYPPQGKVMFLEAPV